MLHDTANDQIAGLLGLHRAPGDGVNDGHKGSDKGSGHQSQLSGRQGGDRHTGDKSDDRQKECAKVRFHIRPAQGVAAAIGLHRINSGFRSLLTLLHVSQIGDDLQRHQQTDEHSQPGVEGQGDAFQKEGDGRHPRYQHAYHADAEQEIGAVWNGRADIGGGGQGDEGGLFRGQLFLHDDGPQDPASGQVGYQILSQSQYSGQSEDHYAHLLSAGHFPVGPARKSFETTARPHKGQQHAQGHKDHDDKAVAGKTGHKEVYNMVQKIQAEQADGKVAHAKEKGDDHVFGHESQDDGEDGAKYSPQTFHRFPSLLSLGSPPAGMGGTP